MQIWDLRCKRSVQTLEDQYQILSVCFGDEGDQVYSAGIENMVKVGFAWLLDMAAPYDTANMS